MILDSEVRQILTESLTFENANSESKGVIRALKARPAPIENGLETQLILDLMIMIVLG